MKNWKSNFNKGALTVSTETKEPTELEKMQQEYNQKAFLLGNARYKAELLKREQTGLLEEMEKISLAAAELMKAAAAKKEEEAAPKVVEAEVV